METDEQGMTPFDYVVMQAQNEVSLLEDEINAKQYEITELKEQQRKWNKIIKAASDEPSSYTKSVKTRSPGIRETTRQKVVDAIMGVRVDNESNDFKTIELAPYAKLSEATLQRAISVLRDEGLIRQIGKEGQAPVYRWVGD